MVEAEKSAAGGDLRDDSIPLLNNPIPDKQFELRGKK